MIAKDESRHLVCPTCAGAIDVRQHRGVLINAMARLGGQLTSARDERPRLLASLRNKNLKPEVKDRIAHRIVVLIEEIIVIERDLAALKVLDTALFGVSHCGESVVEVEKE